MAKHKGEQRERARKEDIQIWSVTNGGSPDDLDRLDGLRKGKEERE
jgi:hypothetical protein